MTRAGLLRRIEALERRLVFDDGEHERGLSRLLDAHQRSGAIEPEAARLRRGLEQLLEYERLNYPAVYDKD